MSTEARDTPSVVPAMGVMLLVAALALALSTLRAAPEPVGQGDTIRAAITLSLSSGQRVYDDQRVLTLTDGALVPGVLDAFLGMKPGEARRVEIPPDRAYGPRGRGDIPPNATLIADLEVIRVVERAD